jgi:hypothetical protein
MLGNTLTLPHADGNIVLTKINQDVYSSEYMFRNATHQVVARIRHTKTKPNGKPSADRHNFEVVETIFAVDEMPEMERKFYFVIEQQPKDTDVKNADAVADLMIATSNAFLVSLLGWES